MTLMWQIKSRTNMKKIQCYTSMNNTSSTGNFSTTAQNFTAIYSFRKEVFISLSFCISLPLIKNLKRWGLRQESIFSRALKIFPRWSIEDLSSHLNVVQVPQAQVRCFVFLEDTVLTFPSQVKFRSLHTLWASQADGCREVWMLQSLPFHAKTGMIILVLCSQPLW